MGFAVHKVALEQVSLRVILFYPISIVPPMLHTLYSHVAPNRTKGRSLGAFYKAVATDICANLQRPATDRTDDICVHSGITTTAF